MNTPEAIAYPDVLAAYDRIHSFIRKTPLLENPLLNKLAGRRILVKAECLQLTGSFKFRGAMSAISNLSNEQRQSGVIAYSSGNHAQGIALASQMHNVDAVIVMPDDAPKLKLENTRQYGAEVILYDRQGGEDREALGNTISQERGLYLIKPYDNPQVMAGQATCGIEIAEQAKDANINAADVLVCCGGGGLTSGISISLEDNLPDLNVRPVEPMHYDDVIRSQQSGQRENVDTDKRSICDAIVTPSPGELTFPIIKRLCGNGIVVTDDEALHAMAIAMKYFKIIAEPGGAVSLAAAISHSKELNTDTVICVVSGGNADDAMIERAMKMPINLQM